MYIRCGVGVYIWHRTKHYEAKSKLEEAAILYPNTPMIATCVQDWAADRECVSDIQQPVRLLMDASKTSELGMNKFIASKHF